MKLHLLLIVLATASAHYHARIGVPAAARIWQLENGGETRITGGLPSYRSLHPFFAGLLIALPMNLTSVCGSTLLTDTKLITAGHCWNDGERQAILFEVVLASVRLFTGGTRIITADVVPHEAYVPETIYNDIAMITVPPVQFSELIRPISLPVENLFSSHEGRVATVVGYGKTGDASEITGSQSLRFAFVTVKPKEECAIYGNLFGASMICTNGIYGGSCGGDSGGPLFISERSGEKYLIGVVSYGSAYGCEAGHPTVFTRISSFIDWIYDKICY
ncbi:collagenase-like [Ostrinia furnacalis]|uniref:collagenase-like n=1 Tax=Ostrinia furnacalis TaxID=93504 RepID=UPI00103F8594|nr:collagenase-like [Ostrinia furnacalis]